MRCYLCCAPRVCTGADGWALDVQALKEFGIADDVQELARVADKNGDGQIDYQEFVLLMRETNKELREGADAGAGGGSLLRQLGH